MNNLSLIPGDVILFAQAETNWFGKLKAWVMESHWGHVSIFYGIGEDGSERMAFWNPSMSEVPLHIESIDRGVLKTDLRNQKGRGIKVLRHHNVLVSRQATLQAVKFSREGKRWYDYWCIIRYVIPYLVVKRLFHTNCGFGYRHNDKFVCSEMVDAAYGYVLFDDNRRFPTLPTDYIYAQDLKCVWGGIF